MLVSNLLGRCQRVIRSARGPIRPVTDLGDPRPVTDLGDPRPVTDLGDPRPVTDLERSASRNAPIREIRAP
jgi:hypothetical protein